MTCVMCQLVLSTLWPTPTLSAAAALGKRRKCEKWATVKLISRHETHFVRLDELAIIIGTYQLVALLCFQMAQL